MAIYSLYLPRTLPASQAMLADRGKIIIDRFSWFGFFLPVIALLQKRLWLWALLIILIEAAIGIVMAFGQTPAGLVMIAHLCVMVLVGLELSSWQSRALERRGYRLIDIVEARDEDDALARALMAMTHSREETVLPTSMPSSQSHGVIGLFPSPGSSR